MGRNGYLDRQRQRDFYIKRETQYLNERQCLDAMIVALHEMGFGKDRINKTLDAYVKYRREIADMFMNDRYDNKDKDMNYSKEKLDRAMRQFMGDDFPDFETRYGQIDIGKPMFDGGMFFK